MKKLVCYLAASVIVLTTNMMIFFGVENDEQSHRQPVTERGSDGKYFRQFSATGKQTRRNHPPESLLLHPSQLSSLKLPLFLRDIMSDPTVYNIYLVVTRLPSTLSLRHFCSLESFLLENPDATVWFLMLGLDSLEGNSMRLLDGMRRKYLNLELASLDLMLTVKDTPLESIVTTGKLNQSAKLEMRKSVYQLPVGLRNSHHLTIWCNSNTSNAYPANHLSDVLRLALVSKAGGLYTDFDFICLRSVTGIRNSMAQEHRKMVTSELFHFDAGHPFLQLTMVETGINFQPMHWSWNGPNLFTRLLAEYCRGYHFKNPTNGKTDLINKIKMELHLQTPEPFPPKESVNASSIARVHDPNMAERLCRSVTLLEPSTFRPMYAGGMEKLIQNGSVDTLLKVPVESYALHLLNAFTRNTVLVEDSALHVVARRYCPQTHATVHDSPMTL